MSEDRQYFEEELNYLIEAGREYARLHPDRARFLNLSDSRSRDPHVQRLIESFAFLTGTIRRRLDDDFPEITNTLLELVWPHQLRPIPPLALLRFTPIPGMVREPQVIPRGFLVDSRPTSQEVACRFSTAFPVTLLPLSLEQAALHTNDAGQQVLRLRLCLDPAADPASLQVERLRLYLAGEPSVAFRSYQVLRSSVECIVLSFSRERRRVLPASAVQPVGFAGDQNVLPASRVGFPGYRLLAEYFAFPEKFRFIDLVGLGALEPEPGQDHVDLEIRFSRRPPEGFRPTTDSFELYVTPIVNLFPRDGEPITVDHLRSRYRVIADYTHADAYDVISVDRVEGIRSADGARRVHLPFSSFGHDGGGSEAEVAAPLAYVTSQQRNAAGRWTTFLSLVSSTRRQLPSPETLSLELTCSNGALCREVGLEDVRYAAGERLDLATFRNITRPTNVIYPKQGQGSEWRFISHMSLAFLSLSEREALRTILALYNSDDDPANQRRIDSISSVTTTPVDRLLRGAPVRGTRVTLTIDERHFDESGDLLLFTEVLNELLALHATINSFTELVIHLVPSDRELRCPPAVGRKSLL